jgi:hypothetical protein
MSTTEINVGSLGSRYLIDGSLDGSLGIFELTVPPASNVPPPHSHSNNEEIVYVLEGTLRYAVGADTRTLPRVKACIRRRARSCIFQSARRDRRALIIMSPDIGAQYFKDVAVVVNRGGPRQGRWLPS